MISAGNERKGSDTGRLPVEGSALPPQAEFDAMIGQSVARAVMQKDPAQRRQRPAAPVPEEVGEKGSRLYRCLVTGEVAPREEMVRFVVGPDHRVVPDLEENLPGQGYWVRADHKTLGRAIAEDVFSRAAGSAVTVSPALSAEVAELTRQSCLNLFGLARRTWAVELGYDHVRAGLLACKLGLVFVASNAPLEFRQRLSELTRQTPVLTLFTTAQLSQALGQQRLAFVGIHKGQWSARLLAQCTRLAQILAPSAS